MGVNRQLGKHPNSHNKSNRRCSFDKCDKLAKDFVDGKPLCRIHSPSRLGYGVKR